jgi:hypothetical protein
MSDVRLMLDDCLALLPPPLRAKPPLSAGVVGQLAGVVQLCGW